MWKAVHKGSLVFLVGAQESDIALHCLQHGAGQTHDHKMVPQMLQLLLLWLLWLLRLPRQLAAGPASIAVNPHCQQATRAAVHQQYTDLVLKRLTNFSCSQYCHESSKHKAASLCVLHGSDCNQARQRDTQDACSMPWFGKTDAQSALGTREMWEGCKLTAVPRLTLICYHTFLRQGAQLVAPAAVRLFCLLAKFFQLKAESITATSLQLSTVQHNLCQQASSRTGLWCKRPLHGPDRVLVQEAAWQRGAIVPCSTAKWPTAAALLRPQQGAG